MAMLETPAEFEEAWRAPVGENVWLAGKLREYADLLGEQGANAFRVRAYAKAAELIERLREPVSDILSRAGRDGLDALPGVGPRIASTLAELSRTGRWEQLERARGAASPETLFRTIPGVGRTLARRLVENLHLSSLEALETAAHDGTLGAASGWGPRRVHMLQAALAQRLGRPRRQHARVTAARPRVSVLLDVDREYRERANAGGLTRIAPRRFNPHREAWLPILHTERAHWRFTALFSNTPLAHRLGRTHDWVVIFYETDGSPEGQCTVVTETRGPRKGQRVVRGREDECSATRRESAELRSVEG